MSTIQTSTGLSATAPATRPTPSTAAVVADKPALEAPTDSVVARPQSLAALAAPAPAPAPPADADWGTGARVATIAAGVVGGALVAGAVAFAAGVGGMNLGAIVLNSLYREQLPKAIALSGLTGFTNSVILAAPVAGGLAGGLVGSIASHKKHATEMSQVPGSGLGDKKPVTYDSVGARAKSDIGAVLSAVKEQFRGAGEGVHEGVNGVAHAESFLGAVKSGGQGAYAFGSRLGQVGGALMGVAQGAYLGTLLAGMPFAFAPLTAIPVAFVAAVGIGTAMSKAGGVLAGSVAATGGAVVGGAAYGVKKAVGD